MNPGAAEKNLRHEVTAVEEGHRAFLTGGGSCRIVSDRVDGTHYTVTAQPLRNGSGLIAFECDHGQVLGFLDRTNTAAPGVVPCKHAALLARRLERERLARLDDGRWRLR